MPHARVEPTNVKTPDDDDVASGIEAAEAVVPQGNSVAQNDPKPLLQKEDSFWTKLRRAATSPLFKKKKSKPMEMKKFAVEVPLEGLQPSTLLVSFDIDAPHTLSWEEDVHQPDSSKATIDVIDGHVVPVLPKGSCCLYVFPKVTTEWDPTGSNASEDGVRVLRQILSCLASKTNAFQVPDPVGAFPIHALVVCNSPQSLQVSMSLYREHPQWLMQVHAAAGPFSGESALHILAVNKCEELFVELVELAKQQLDSEDTKQLVLGHTEGAFFDGMPMRLYGSTPLSYACCFDLRKAVIALLSTGYCQLNRREDGCNKTGLLPLHAVVANSREDTYDFLTKELPPRWRADSMSLTRTAKLTPELTGLTPLQLAGSLGDRALVRHILKNQCEVMWVWGPVTQFALSLQGIDAAGKGGGDIMELIVRTDARRRTCEMLLDSFMNGFIYKLFLEKWERFGRKIHYARRLIDLALLVSLTTQTYIIKSHPERLVEVRSLSILAFILMGAVIEEEARATYLFVQEGKGEGDARLPLAAQIKYGASFLWQHNMQVVMIAYTCTFIGGIFILSDGFLPDPDTLNVTQGWFTESSRFDGHVTQDDIDFYSTWTITDEGNWAYLWIAQSMALLLLVFHLATTVFQPFQSLSILLNTIQAMVREDLGQFMTVFLWLFVAFYLALFILYPRSGSHTLPYVPTFNLEFRSAFDLLNLSILGESVEFLPLMDAAMAHGAAQTIAITVWLVVYYIWVVLSVILMLNLLIAMLTNTFDDVFDESVLKSRMSFAIGVMKLEVFAKSFGMKTAVGEPYKGSMVYKFRSVERRDVDGGEEAYELAADEGGVADPFAPPPPSETGKVYHFVKEKFKVLEDKVALLSQSHSGWQ